MTDSFLSLARLHETPELTNEQVGIITDLVFFAPQAQASDVMLVFGAPEGDWSAAAKAYHDGLAKLIVASGGLHGRTKGISEAKLIKETNHE